MPVRDRVLKHACVIAAACAIPLLAPRAGEHLPTAAAAAPVSADVVTSAATIERQPLTPGLVERPAQTILVNPGDTVESLAQSFHADAGAIRWANNLLDVSQPDPGTPLLVPPGPGALAQVQGWERPSHIASRLGMDPRVILDYNSLRSDAGLPPATYVQIPRSAAPASALLTSAVVPVAPGVPGVPSTQMSHGDVNRYPWGQCTYYVATRRVVPWGGDAWTWFANARPFSRPEGQVPVEGAIAVTWGSWVGHVAFVEHVNPDGSFVISEMNVRGRGVIDTRTVTARSVDLIGFIY